MKRILTVAFVCAMAMCVSARPGLGPGFGGHYHHPHHHHSRTAWGVGAGILGAGLVASTIYNATHPAPVVVAQPTVVTPAPVVVSQPVVTGHYETRLQNVWVEGRYIDQSYNGIVQRVWQPAHYEQQQVQVWVTP